MGEYLMGNEIKDEQTLKQWKEFINEAEDNLRDKGK